MVWGGWDGHEPKQCVDIFAPILREKGFDVEVSDTLDSYLNREKMLWLSLVVPVWTMGTIAKEQEAGLLDAVKSGGIAGWHGGMGDRSATTPNTSGWSAGRVAHPATDRLRVSIVNHGDRLLGLKISRCIPEYCPHRPQQ